MNVVTMYRYGNKEGHSYIIGLYEKFNDAVAAGEEEANNRGGKYEYEVCSFDGGGHVKSRWSPKNLDERTAKEFIDSYKLRAKLTRYEKIVEAARKQATKDGWRWGGDEHAEYDYEQACKATCEAIRELDEGQQWTYKEISS